MATTTNYGWETPDDTDLVKDGAAAIRTLGSSIDTTTKALNPETTLGDIAYRSSTANTNTRLGIGTTGQVLTVSGGVPAWASPAAPTISSNWTLVSSGSVTTGTTASLSVSGYDRYIVHFNIYIAGNPTVKWRFNNLSASNYRYAAGLSGAWTTQTDVDGINLDNFSTWDDQPNGFLEINNANSSGKPQFFGSWKRANNPGDARRAYLLNYSGLYNANINLSSIDLVSTSTIGDFSYRVWGQ
jgi:hypothetical protein